jgi:hypothetical protein
VVFVAAYGMLRRAAGSEFVTLVALLLFACLRADTRSWQTMAAPNEYIVMALAAWQLGYGAWSRTMPRLAFGGTALAILLGRQLQLTWLFEHHAFWLIQSIVVWCTLLPLFCRDALARAIRTAGPFWIAVIPTVAMLTAPWIWFSVPAWALAALPTAMVVTAVLYWAVLRVRWYVLSAIWTSGIATLAWTGAAIDSLKDAQLRRGLTMYAIGWLLLAIALVISLWKARLLHRGWRWLQSVAITRHNGATQISSNSQ